MSFTLELTDEQQALREKTAKFAREVIRPAATEYDKATGVPLARHRRGGTTGPLQVELYAELSVDPTCF